MDPTYDPSSQLPRFPMTQVMDQGPVSFPAVADVMYIQQQFAAGAPPSLVVSVVPLTGVWSLTSDFASFCKRRSDHVYVFETDSCDDDSTVSGVRTGAAGTGVFGQLLRLEVLAAAGSD